MSAILVIDDEPSLLKAMEMSLRREGYEVISATNAHQAIQTASSWPGGGSP